MEEKRQSMLQLLSKETSFSSKVIQNVVSLIEEGNTVPFIARYRKELTGSLDEVQIRTIVDRWTYINNLETRKEEVVRLIQEQDKLTEELHGKILKATKLQEVEDLYRPYKQKRRTRATVAKEKGLEPLAQWLISFPSEGDVEKVASEYISEEKEVNSVEDALSGAKDIIAEWISDDPEIRQKVRHMTFKEGRLSSSVKDKEKDEKGVFEMYYEYEEHVGKIVPHRILALNRGEKEGVIKVSLLPPLDKIISLIGRKYIKQSSSPVTSHIEEAVGDSYKRLIEPSIEREIRKELSEKAEDQAIHIFSENLRNLLLQPPLKGRVVLGVDPAYRTGCKLAVVDETGKVLHIAVIYPTPPKNEIEKGKQAVLELIKKFDIEVVAVGNGTASRETEQFIANVIKEVEKEVYYLIVNEAGASVYSASPLGREEFPDLQVEERSAISIARRLQDPLAELVKIDPKSVGVGQYQHDVTQSKLNDQLTFVVETVVNQVGVNVNTASSSLLQYVSGLSKTVANNIVKKREEEGKFSNRSQLKKIPRLGAKTYEQCIGFLRVIDGAEPLDQTGIHPESYKETKKILKEVGASTEQIGSDELSEKLKQLNVREMAEELGIGVPTLQDIIDALIRPRRDPRDEVATPLLKKDVLQLEDLQTGMELQGTIRNVVDFGAFVDIGVKQDGLVHISKLTNRFVKHPMEVVSVGDVVTVWVDSVDIKKQRIALTMLQPEKQLS
ncbi:RNA-binding transcriptional accessory protein [Anaerobacillus arseniciselenatis]|uniref:RNA-binding transcriptional accessory protein n=1 Tax=Anaerobacillus arseniciselenatis TaxID=85682 RepID=A0A1S2LQA7_9BACI|nr:Tex family protein [Anaerobacillus arseniciselenatis]OIJ14576.1 RNA-binding transcriptional accessory protein [Anaerobacillus arseniciselenatis]